MRRLILRNFQAPGDIVMLTAAVRDLHRAHPGQFLTDVRTPYPALWENNPNITPLDDNDPSVEHIDCEYPLIHLSNFVPYHFLQGFMEFLNERIPARIRPTEFKGDIHLSEAERQEPPPFADVIGNSSYWIIVAGGKSDFTIKWWSYDRFQQVADRLHGRLLFVQAGRLDDRHPRIQGTIDVRGTSLRELIRLTYHADGVLSPVSLPMHLAAAVEARPGRPKNRACVVVAGGREPPQWEAYPHHQFVHTVGAMRCCDQGGCWKSRTLPLGDGSEHDRPENLCVDVRGELPRCMDMISAVDVVRRIELYLDGGVLPCATR